MEDFYKNSEKRLLEQQERLSLWKTNLMYMPHTIPWIKIIPNLKYFIPAVIAMAKRLELQVDSTQTWTH